MAADRRRVGTGTPRSIPGVWTGSAPGRAGGGSSPNEISRKVRARRVRPQVGDEIGAPTLKVRTPRGSGQAGQLEAAGLAAVAGDDDEPDDEEPDDEEDPGDEEVDVEEDAAGVVAGVDAAGLRAVDFAPARASLR